MCIRDSSAALSPHEILRILLLREGAGTAAYNVLLKIRLPRVLAAAVMGGTLSVSGFLLQTFFRNPIAGPYVLGVSSGEMCIRDRLRSTPLALLRKLSNHLPDFTTLDFTCE